MTSEQSAPLTNRIFHAAWLSIGIAIVTEIALLIAAAAFGDSNELKPFIADLGGKIAWSMVVCVGISIGMVASAVRGPAMGLLGLLSAPTGFALAKAAHKSVAQGLDVTIAASSAGPSAMQMIVIRALEYGLLGLAVGFISRKSWGRLPVYAALGFVTGAVAATIVLAETARTSATPVPMLAMVSKGINEVLFPLGCSMVLYAANALGQRMRLAVAA